MSELVEHEFGTGKGIVHYWTSRRSLAPAQNALWLVFLPGLTADHTLFDEQIAHFAGKCNMFVWDAPAYGLSRPYPLDFSMDDYARILHAILQTEDIQCPVLVGQSLGGYVAQAYMDLFPDCVSGFISLDSAPLKKKYYPKWYKKFPKCSRDTSYLTRYSRMRWYLQGNCMMSDPDGYANKNASQILKDLFGE